MLRQVALLYCAQCGSSALSGADFYLLFGEDFLLREATGRWTLSLVTVPAGRIGSIQSPVWYGCVAICRPL